MVARDSPGSAASGPFFTHRIMGWEVQVHLLSRSGLQTGKHGKNIPGDVRALYGRVEPEEALERVTGDV